MITEAPDMAARERELNSLYIVTVVVILVVVTATFGALIFVFWWRSQNQYLWEHLQIPSLLWLTTLILLASSVLLERARKAMRTNQPLFYRDLQWTTGLGVLFLIGQACAWLQVMHSNAGLANDKHHFFILLFSGIHGVHIVAGLGALGYLVYRAHEQVSGPRYQMTTRAYTNAFSIFWHYLGFVWIVLFVLLLTWRR